MLVNLYKFFIKKIKFLSIFFSTIIFAIMICDTINPTLLRPKKITDFSTKEKAESELEYFKRIGKTQQQIKISIASDYITNIIKISPVVLSLIYKNPLAYITYAGTYFTEFVVGGGLRVLIKEQRPDDVSNKTSFPSGHAIFAFGATCMILILIKKRRNRQIVFIVYFFLSCLVSVFRLLSNRHYPIDVLFGAIIGSLSFCISYYICSFANKRLKLFF
jgi:membrane-associated phospholipid phosphatase